MKRPVYETWRVLPLPILSPESIRDQQVNGTEKRIQPHHFDRTRLLIVSQQDSSGLENATRQSSVTSVTSLDMLAKTVDHSGRDWDKRIPYVLYAYRTSVQESTQESPFYLLYGRDARLLTEAALAKPRTCFQVDIDDFKTDHVCNLSDAWEMARQNICQSQKKQKQQYDRKAKLKKYSVGDRVFVHMPGDVRGKVWKFAKPFHGPYRILEMTPTNASVRLVDRPQDAPIFVSLDRIRMCPKEMPDRETWSGRNRRRRNRRRKTVQYRNHIPASSSGLQARDDPPGDNTPEPGSWSTRLRPCRGRGRP